VERDPSDAQQRCQREHERGREEAGVQPEGTAVEEEISDHPERDGADEETDSCPFASRHPPKD
jgi:hypothetical protein